MKNSKYWRQRFKQLEAAQNQMGAKSMKDIHRIFQSAQKNISSDIARWYQRFAANTEISLAEANKWLTPDELKEFKRSVQEYIKHGEEYAISDAWAQELENAFAKYHISRLRSLEIQVRQELESLYGRYGQTLTKTFGNVYERGYYHSAFEIQKGLGMGWDIAGIDQLRIEKVLSKSWAADEYNFFDRIWKNKEKLIHEVHTTLTQNILRGQDPQKSIDFIAEKLETAKRNAGRLVMTEEAYFSCAAQKEAFKDLGVEQYEIIAALDTHTSDICRSLAGKVYPMKDYEAGVTAPPFHVWCRSTTAPYFEDNFDIVGQRAARDEDGKTYYVPADTTFEQWKQMQDAKYGAGSVDKLQQMAYNEGEDREQYDNYKVLLGVNAPKSFSAFQSIKYSDLWKDFKVYARAIKSGELTPLADFDLYMDISRTIERTLVGVSTSNGILITGKSDHFICRTIGSVEQRRNGVQITDILEALTSNDSEIFPIKQRKNGKSQSFKHRTVEITVNPDTGRLIQTNPRHKRKEKEK